MGLSRWVRAVVIGVALGAGFAACAKGNQLGNVGGGGVGGGTTTNPNTGGSGGGMPDAGPTGLIGSECPDGVCKEGDCTLVGSTKYCTTACPPECPMGTYCSVINGNSICVPDLGQQCDKCSAATDCKLPSDNCLKAPPGDSFCARDCTVDGLCPNGFECVDMGSYEAPDAGADGGSDAGADAGKDAGADAGKTDAGSGDAGPPTTPTKWCVPDMGASCPCNAKRDGVSHTCTISNANGTCHGTETCNGSSSAWKGCTASTPVAEACNGMDDNCNGKIDEGTGDMLCASKGPHPPHASWACVSGMCQLGACDPGWTSYPAGNTTNGCPCQIDANEPNGTCSAAKNVGMVTDVGAPLTIQGTLSSATNTDFYTFNTVDTSESGTNSYHVNIAFTQPSPNNEFVMDVMRGGPCTDTPTGPATNITSYDWCVNGTDGTKGESPCGPATANVPHCADHSSAYYIRVYRKAGATGTCTPYSITVKGGGGTCDMTQTCP